VQGSHGARPGEELVAESVEMRLDLCRRQRRRRVLLYVHHVLAAHAEPDNHMRPVRVDEPATGSMASHPEFQTMSVRGSSSTAWNNQQGQCRCRCQFSI
jgi:hypothetical protein